MLKIVALLVVLLLALWLAPGAWAQKDRMHMGEALIGTVIKSEATQPLHAQPGAKRASGELQIKQAAPPPPKVVPPQS